ncbi:uncharacterized protein [Amphiura filiformis]|uniref:uncharacterized protein isoform X2 n=1 Tax=Amphiura filiformis TaxID=82378 RepID=UPI003B216001
MGKFKCKILALTTCTALLLQAQAENRESCTSEDLFWDISDEACRTCTRCGVGMQSTAESCGHGQGSQGICEVCPTEYYQDKQHTKEQCKRCIHCDPDAGLELRSCSAELDRLCGCQLGFGVNPFVANTCIKCDIWEGEPLEGCDRTTTKKSNTVTPTGHTSRTNYTHILTPIADQQQDDVDQSLSDAAVISISVVCAVVLMVCIIGGAVLALYYFCGLGKKSQPPPVKMNNADPTQQLPDTNGNRSMSISSTKVTRPDFQTTFLATSTPVVPSGPSFVILPEEVTPLMNAKHDENDTKPSNSTGGNHIKTINGLAPCAKLAPTLRLLNMERWTPQGTPQGTPRGTPKPSPKPSPVFNRSLSAPCGDKQSYSDQSFTPRSSIVEEGDDQSLALSEKTRKGAMQCQEQLRLKKLQGDKQKARSIGAHHNLSDFIQDFNATRTLSRMLEISDNSIKSDWRDLAADWGCLHADIIDMIDIAKRGNNTGLALLFEKDNAENFGMRNLEHLLDGLEKIKREDAVQYLAQYLLKKSNETTL